MEIRREKKSEKEEEKKIIPILFRNTGLLISSFQYIVQRICPLWTSLSRVFADREDRMAGASLLLHCAREPRANEYRPRQMQFSRRRIAILPSVEKFVGRRAQ